MMQNDSTEVANLECYAESFWLSTHCRILGGKFPFMNSSTALLMGGVNRLKLVIGI